MSVILECLGLSSSDFFTSSSKVLWDDKRKIYGQVKQDKNGNYHIVVGDDSMDRRQYYNY